MRWRVDPPIPYYLHESWREGMQAMSERRGLGPIASAIGDARSKLIDEAWFGRRTADGPGPTFRGSGKTPGMEDDFEGFQHAWSLKPSTEGAVSSGQSFEDAWALREPTQTPGADAVPDIGIDR